MERTDEYLDAVTRHEQSIGHISSLLEAYRDGRNLNRETSPETELDAAADRYEQTSIVLTGLIAQQLVRRSADGADDAADDAAFQQDDDAAAGMTALLEIDAALLNYTTMITALRDSDGAEYALRPGQLTEAELDALSDQETAQAYDSAFEVLRGGIGAGTPLIAGAATTTPFDVGPYFDAILSRTSADILGTVASGVAWEKMIAHALLHQIADFGTRLPKPLQHGWTALRRLLGKAWRQGLSKILLLVGPAAASIGQFTGGIVALFAPDVEGWGIAAVLRKALNIKKPQEEAQNLAAGKPERAAEVEKACSDVQAHHLSRRKAVRFLNAALTGCKYIPVYGLQLQIGATALLLIYEVWLAHDHLDSPVLAKIRIPKNSGLLTGVKLAVA
jgi:hypothetical protein